MLKCQVNITLCDGSRGCHQGLYACTIDAILRALELFPGASKVSARAMP